MTNKAPNPIEYWDGLYDLLSTVSSNGELLRELQTFRLLSWDGASIAYRMSLGKRLSTLFGNPYNYAIGTFVDALRKAMIRRRQYERVEQMIKVLTEDSPGEYEPCTKRREGIHELKLEKTTRGLTGIVEKYYCRHCNTFQYKVVQLC